MNAEAFLADLLAKPHALTQLGEALGDGNPWAPWISPGHPPRIVLTGMGSSTYAAGVAAARLRHNGFDAVAELASTDLPTRWPAPDSLVVAISATGGSRETLGAIDRLSPNATTLALTNDPGSPIAEKTTGRVLLHAGQETGGVACRTFQHTLIQLLALQVQCRGEPLGPLLATIERTVEATQDLLSRRAEWLPELRRQLAGPDGIHVAAPARRFSSAQQSALMLREGPRVPATGCESGDWAHVDVYLTKNTDYRLLVYSGSCWEDGITGWTRPRRTTVVSVGGEISGGAMALRYRHDDDDDVRLLTETLAAELLAADLWGAAD